MKVEGKALFVAKFQAKYLLRTMIPHLERKFLSATASFLREETSTERERSFSQRQRLINSIVRPSVRETISTPT